MPANTSPIFTITPEVQWSTVAMTVANTTKDLSSGGTNYLVFTAGPSGSYVQRIRFRQLGANTAATVARVFINNGQVTSSAANNVLYDDVSLPIVTNNDAAGANPYEIPLNFALPANYQLYVTLGTAPTSAGWAATVIGGDY